MILTFSSFYGSILKSGIIIGVLDAIAAIVYSYFLSGASPAAVFRYVAGGVFGKSAFGGGLPMAAWGLLFHFTVAISWTALFYLIYPKLKFILRNTSLMGMAYGVFVWLMMNLVVVPLSQVPPRPITINVPTIIMIGIHLLVIGLPMAYLVKKYYSEI